MTVRTRTALDTLPAYAPGRNVPGAIKLASNELSFPTLPSIAAAIADAVVHESSRHQPVPGQRRAGAGRGARRSTPAPRNHSRRRQRVGRAVPATGAGGRRRGRRGAVRLALVRGLPDRHPDHRRHLGPGAGHRRARTGPARAGRGDHPGDPADLRLHPEQPDRHGRPAVRSGRLPGRRAGRRAGRHRRGLPRFRHRPRLPRRPRVRADQAERADPADDVEGLRAGRAPGRLRGRRPARDHRAAQGRDPVRAEFGGAGRRAGRAGRQGRAGPALAAGDRRTGAGHRRAARTSASRSRRHRRTSSGCRCASGPRSSPRTARRRTR